MMGVSAGVHLDRRHPEVLGCVDGGEVGVDEQRKVDTRLVEAPDRGAEPGVTLRQVEATFGGDLLTSFRDNGDLVRLELAGDGDDFVTDGQLEIAHRPDAGGDPRASAP